MARRAALELAEVTAPPLSVKVVVAGPFGVGKTTLVASVSDIRPLRTEAAVTVDGARIDDVAGALDKTGSTVAMDFGRISIDDDTVLYLFGTPGQGRFGFMWDDLVIGAVGALVLADPRRLADSYPAIDYFEERAIPFVVALNHFDTTYRPDSAAVRYAVNVGSDVPVVDVDARDGESVRQALRALLGYLLTTLAGPDPGAN